VNNVIKLRIYHSKRIFSVFRLKPHICFPHFIPPPTVYKCQLNKVCCAFNSFTSGFRCRWAVPGDRQKGGWPWQTLMSFDGRVAESSRVPHILDILSKLYKGTTILNWWSKPVFRYETLFPFSQTFFFSFLCPFDDKVFKELFDLQKNFFKN